MIPARHGGEYPSVAESLEQFTRPETQAHPNALGVLYRLVIHTHKGQGQFRHVVVIPQGDVTIEDHKPSRDNTRPHNPSW